MEAKKTPQADLVSKSGFFMSIGLMVSLLLVVTAFEWRFSEEGELMNLGEVDADMEEMMEIPPTEQPPPPPPVIQQPEIIEVPDEEEIEEEIEVDLDVEITEETVIEDVVFEEAPEEEEADQIFTIVEQNAAFAGGNKAYAKYLKKNLKYPNQARRMGIEGKVYVQFVIDKQGKISEVKALKGIGGGCDEEAVRVIKNSPAWTPGKQRGRPVKQRMVIPIVFRLGS